MLNADKNLKIYYSISEVADMMGVNEPTLRFWEKEFPQLSPKRAGRGVRQYRKEDIKTVKLIHYLVKERGMTLSGASQYLESYKNGTPPMYVLVEQLKAIREELVAMRDALDAFTYEDVEALKENIARLQEDASS